MLRSLLATLSISLALLPSQAAWVIKKASSGGGGSTYILEETFEGANSGYDESGWTEAGGSVDPDYTTTVLHGTESLRLGTGVSAQGRTTISLPSAVTELWGYILWRPATLDSSEKPIVLALSSSDTVLFEVVARSDELMRTRIAGSASGAMTTAYVEDTTYSLWFHFKNGTGNAIASAGLSTTTTEPTSGNDYVEKTNGTQTTDIAKIRLGFVGNSAYEFIIDRLLVRDDQTVGDSP